MTKYQNTSFGKWVGLRTFQHPFMLTKIIWINNVCGGGIFHFNFIGHTNYLWIFSKKQWHLGIDNLSFLFLFLFQIEHQPKFDKISFLWHALGSSTETLTWGYVLGIFNSNWQIVILWSLSSSNFMMTHRMSGSMHILSPSTSQDSSPGSESPTFMEWKVSTS